MATTPPPTLPPPTTPSEIKLMLFSISLVWEAVQLALKRNPSSFSSLGSLYKDLLRACPRHGFTELHQLDTFYNALNPTDQDSLNSVAGGNLLERSTRDVLTIIENKSKPKHYSYCKSANEFCDYRHDGYSKTIPPPASVKGIEEICVTCGGAHPYYQWRGDDSRDGDVDYIEYETYIEYLLNHDLIEEMESILEDSIDKSSPDNNLSVNDNTYDDPFDFKEEKVKDAKILIDKLHQPGSSDFLPFPECDSVFYEDFFEVDAFPTYDP
ncbi:reverse transcriptase domain-containing protein [Tanacetum coccineum]